MRKLSNLSKIICYTTAVLMMLAVPGISEAGKSAKSAKSGKSGKSSKLKCKMDGTFLNFANADVLGVASTPVVAASIGRCNRGFGKVGSVGLVEVTGPGSGANCVALDSALSAGSPLGVSPTITYNKKGDSILYEITAGDQCFLDSAGVAIVGPISGFCGVGASEAFSSTLAATYTIIPGSSTGKFAGATGTGTITATATHCNPPDTPLGNFGSSTLTGTLIVP